MPPRLNLPQLNSFLELAARGSAPGVRAPWPLGVKRTITSIETRVNARLFDSEAGRMMLTPAGEKLRVLAHRILNEYSAALEEFDQFVEGRRGYIRIAALPSVSSALLPQPIARFQRQHPDVRIDIVEDLTLAIHRAVAKGAVDVGLVTPPAAGGDLNYKPLIKDEIGLVCRHDDPLAEHPVSDWAVFKGRPFIGMSVESDLRSLVETAFARSGLTIEPLYNCENLETIPSLIKSSLGISALPRLTLALMGTGELTWRPLQRPALHRSIGLVTSAWRTMAPAAAHFARDLILGLRQSTSVPTARNKPLPAN